LPTGRPLLTLVVVAAAAAGATVRATLREWPLAAAALVAWILVEHGAPKLLEVDRLVGQSWGLVAAIALAAAAALAVVHVAQGRPQALVFAAPLLAFGTVRFAEHTKWALAAALLALLGLALQTRLVGRMRRRAIPA
jgi:hypothetical protein